MVKLLEDIGPMEGNEPFFETPPQSKKLGNFVLDKNGQIDINRKGIESYGFRLQEINHNTEICSSKDLCDETTTSVSGYSNYKQRIDSMFDDSRSLISDKSKDVVGEKKGSKSLLEGRTTLLNTYEKKKGRMITNNIQEKIEKMFEDISIQGFQKSSSFRNLKGRQKDAKPIPAASTLNHSFKVIYLGAKPLADRTVSLITLQDPLKELYFEYKKNGKTDQVNTLSILKDGLRINTGEKEHLNPFPTIAVWASVKLVFRNTPEVTEYAFLPLIKDPDGIDKNVLFRELRNKDKSIMLEHGKVDESSNPPIFAVVMKNNDLNKQLECHGFICTSSEEAIIIAANLYQALMKKLKRKKEAKEVKNDKTEAPKEEEDSGKAKKTPPPVPKRPPRKKSSDMEEVITELQNTLEITPKSMIQSKPQELKELINELEDTFDSDKKQEKIEVKTQRRGSVPTNVYGVDHEPMRTLRRTASERGSYGIASGEQFEGGDILTKVAIPRSRSFLNANGPLTRYSRRYKANTQNAIESPLGFTELFNEFRLNEGLESTDDILNAIIDAEGMSFNDLKPIYKEFLLKLAAALTKDELYQRSKIIMRRQKKKSRNCSGRKKTFISTTRISKVFKKTASKLAKQKGTRPTNLEFTSIVFQSGNKNFETSTSSASSCRGKPKRKQSTRRRANKKSDRKKNKHLSTTSEESDFFSRRNTTESGGCPNRSSSGYFSCSECSYDSENCSCTSADKCYCTLGQKKNRASVGKTERNKSSPSIMTEVEYDKELTSLKSCSCDTESCANSEKCYCNDRISKCCDARSSKRNHDKMTKILNLSGVRGNCQTPHLHDEKSKIPKGRCKRHNQTIFDQLKQQGFAASDSSLSRAASPSTAWRNNEERTRKAKDCLKASRSLEFLQMRNPESRQQVNECPTPPHSTRIPRSNYEKYLLREIQNTSDKFVEGTRHYCYHGSGFGRSCRRPSLQHQTSSLQRYRQYSSMRSRNESAFEFSDSACERSHRGRSMFSSMRSKSTCDDIFSQVKFPNANSRNSSLRFTRRMDVYDSFYKRGRSSRQDSYLQMLHHTRSKLIDENIQDDYVRSNRVCRHDNRQMYRRNGSDYFQKPDYDFFNGGKSETSETASNGSDRKVLVVSARDPTGKVLYMGASTRGERSGKRLNNLNSYLSNASGNACEALAVKKSAEIAALFSDVAPKTKLHRTGHFRGDKYLKYRNTNMENTLGYLP